MRGPRPPLFALVLLCAATLALRLPGIGYQLPHDAEPDLYVPLLAQRIAVERGDDHPEFLVDRVRTAPGPRSVWTTYYPPLLAQLRLCLPGPVFEAPPVEPLTSHEHAEFASRPLVVTRLLIALLAALMVPATYLLARRFLSSPAALLAAAFIATSTLHVWFSVQARPHAAAASFTLFAILAALRLREKPTWTSYALAGIAGGLAVAALQTGLVAPLAIVAAYVLRERLRGPHVLGPVLTMALLAGAAWMSYPALFDKVLGTTEESAPHGGLHVDEERQLFVAGQPLPIDRFGWPEPARVLGPAWSYDPGFVLAGALGVLLALVGLVRARGRIAREPLRALLVVGVHAVPDTSSSNV